MALGEAALLVKELHALHQLLRQRQYLVLSAEDMVYNNATGNLLEI